jgi:hypothetical protein
VHCQEGSAFSRHIESQGRGSIDWRQNGGILVTLRAALQPEGSNGFVVDTDFALQVAQGLREV